MRSYLFPVFLHNTTGSFWVQSVKIDRLTFLKMGVYCIHKNKYP